MNYNQIAILFLQGTFIAFLVLLLFRFRKKLGIGLLLACLGLFQFLQIFISSSVYISITNNIKVSPGSTILFTVTVFALLIIYIKEDAEETKKVIYTLLITNVLVTLLLQLFGWNLNEISANKPFSVLANLFDSRGWVVLTGTVALLLDTLLIIVLFEFIARYIRFLFLQICITMLLVISFDTVFFSIIAFWSSDNLNMIILTGLISKGVFTIFYSIIFYVYLKYFDLQYSYSGLFKLKDVFKPLTFKQKFEAATEEVKKAEEMYRLLADNSNDLICLHEPDTTLKYISPSIKNLLGYEQSEFLGKQVFNIVHEDDLQSLKDAMEKKVFSNSVVAAAYPIRILHKDGHFVWLEFLSSPVYEEKELNYFVTSIRDVTNRFLAEQKIKSSLELANKREAALKKTSKMAKVGYWEYENATDTYIWSDYVYEICGLDLESKIPPLNEIIKICDKDSLERLRKAHLELNSKGISFDIELRLVNLKKEEVWIRNLVNPIFNDKNEVVGRRGVLQNITDWKKALMELEASKDKIQKTLELLSKKEHSMTEASKIAEIGYWEHDTVNDIVIWSDYVHYISGSDPKDGIPDQKLMEKNFSKESLSKLQNVTIELLTKGIPYDIEMEFINLKKKTVWVRNVAQPIYNNNNEIVGKRGVLQNITDAKKAQQKIEDSNQKNKNYIKLLEKKENDLLEVSKMAKIGYWEYNNIDKSIVWSDYLYEIFGLDSKEIIPTRETLLSFCDENSLQTMEKANKELMLNGTSYDIEMRIINKKNKEVWVRNSVQPMYSKQGDFIGRRGLMQDITIAKIAQLKIEHSKEQIQTTLELLEQSEFSKSEASRLAKIGYWEYSTENVSWSKYHHEIFGLDNLDEVPSREVLMAFFDKESQKKLINANLELSLKGTPYDIEGRLINNKKEELWVRSVVQPVYNKENKIIGRRGLLLNITEQKIKQKVLDEQNEKLDKLNKALNLAQKLSQVGSWQWDMTKDNLVWSDEMYNIFGVSKENFYPTIENVSKVVLPEDIHKTEKALAALQNNKIFKPFEYRIKRPSGEIRYLNAVALENNSENNVFGVTKDITERKIIEDKNLIITERYRNLFDNATVSIWNEDFSLFIKQIDILKKSGVKDVKRHLEQHPELLQLLRGELKINKINKATLKLFKAKNSKEFLDKTLDIFGKDSDVVFARSIEAIWNNDSIFTSEINYRTLHGEEFAAIVSFPIPQTEIEQKNVPVSIQSIQSIKDAESARIESLNRLKEAQELAHIGSWRYDLETKESEWSEESFRVWGFDNNEVMPERDEFMSRIHLDDRESFKNAASLIYQGIPYDIEFRICLPNNEIKTIRSICKPIFCENGKVISLKGTNQDITAQKIIEEKNFIISERYKNLFDNATISIWNEDFSLFFKDIEKLKKQGIQNIKGYLDERPEKVITLLEKIKVNAVNKATLKLFKAKTSEEFKLKIKDTFGLGANKVFQKLIEAIWNNKKSFTAEVNYKTLEGDEFVAILSIPIPQTIIEQKTVPISIQSIQSIIEAEREKMASLNSLKEAQKLAKIGNWLFCPLTKKRKWSDEMFHIWGFNPKKMYPKYDIFINRIHVNDREFFNYKVKEASTKGISYDIEFRISLPNKKLKWIRSICNPILDNSGNYYNLEGTNQDITVQKQIEEKNLIITQRYRKLFDNATVSIWNQDFTLFFKEINKLKKQKIPNIKEYLEQNSKVLFSLVYKIKVNKVNKATLKLFKAKNNKDFLGNVMHVFGKGASWKFGKFIEAIWSNELNFTAEVNYKTLEGEEFAAVVSIPIPKTELEHKNVPVIIQSIQSIKDAETVKKVTLNKLREAEKIGKLGSWLFVPSTGKTEWSEETFRIYGLDPQKGIPSIEVQTNLVHKEDRDLVFKAISSETDFDIEHRINLLDGTEKWIRVICKPNFTDDGVLINLAGTFQDITLQKEARNRLEKAEEMYRILTDNSNDIICLLEADRSFKYISPSIKNILGYEQNEFIGKQIFNVVHKEDLKSLKEILEKRLSEDNYKDPISFRILHKDGHYIWLEFLSSPVYTDNKINHFVLSARDITQWVLAKEEIQEYQSSLQSLTKEITLVEEKQKKEIASNIHDHLSQSLVISKMRIKELKKNPVFTVIKEDLKFIETHISDALENSRKITFELSPPILYQLGIIDALNWLLENLEATHKIEFRMDSDVNFVKLNDLKSILLYRSIQEVIINAIKHGNASLITITINKDEDGVNITVEDNGIGFDTSILKNFRAHSGSGFGLFAAQERIKNIQGEFSIISEKNTGTSVKIFIPLDV